MTSLDTLVSILEPKCTFTAAIQNTPQNILLVVTSKDFLECISVLKKYNVKLRFLEERTHSLDIHLSLSIQEVFYEVSFRVIEYSSDFFEEVEKLFPHATVFIQEILGG